MAYKRGALGYSALGLIVSVAACANDFDASRTPPPRQSLGEEMFGVLCDRVGAQALHDDLTGASFDSICHRQPDGTFTSKVNVDRLPPIFEGAPNVDGTTTTAAKQTEVRNHGIARIEAFAKRRADVIAALDFTIPDIKVPIKDIKNPDPHVFGTPASCSPPQLSGEGRLHEELSDLLGRFTDLYDDGTIPESTESLARVMNAFKASPDAQAAYARLDARQGYRPIDIALGTTRPMLGYPHLRDLSNATLRLLSADSNPYDPNPKLDSDGKRIPVAGAAYPQLVKLLEVAHGELRDVTADPVLASLGVLAADPTGRQVLPRPRTNPEIAQKLVYAEVLPGVPSARWITKRDSRGYAQVIAAPDGRIPAPFVDNDHDGLPDVDLLGRFVTNDGSIPASPFFAVGTVPSQRDQLGRALNATGTPVYDYLDTSKTFAASVLNDLKPLVNADPTVKHETLMYAVAGAPVLFGQRDGTPKSQKQYSPDPSQLDAWKIAHPNDAPPSGLGTSAVTLQYDAFHPETSAIVDLSYALGQLTGDKSADETLVFAKEMVTNHLPDLARLVGDMLYAKTQVADKHPEAKIPARSVFWDEIIDTVVQIAKEPGLLEEVLAAFANDDNASLGSVLGKYMSFKDRISYNPNDLNGKPFNWSTNDTSEMQTPVDRTQSASGKNKSGFQRFVQALHDTNGVSACNKAGAIVHAKGIPLLSALDLPNDSNPIVRLNYGTKTSFGECEVFKIENLSMFYVQSLAGAANLYFRDSFLRNGFLGIGASTVDIIQQSSGIIGFFDPLDSKTFRPRPEWLSRLVFFDYNKDSTNASDPYYQTNRFIKDLQGNQFGTIVCPERVIPDPVPDAPDARPDKTVHLRACQDGDWFFQRDQDSTFVFEDFGFQKAIAPVVTAFVHHKREDLFMNLMEVVYRHWQDDTAPPADCNLGYDKNGQPLTCTKDGVVSYEPLVSEVLASDIMLALHDITKTIAGLKFPHCTKLDADPAKAKLGICAADGVEQVDGLALLAETTRAAVDPDRALAVGLKDRNGLVTSLRNDGTTNPQVTPLYLILQALNSVDTAFTTYAATHPDDTERQANWKMARSQLVDQFLDVDGQNTPKATFKNVAIPKLAPVLLDMMREQLWAHCPTSFTPPYDTCTWARTETTKKLSDTVGGPTFAAAVDLFEGIRQDDEARRELENLFAYMLDAASKNEALAAVLTSLADGVQAMSDDTNLVPIYKVLSTAAAASVVDDRGRVVQKSLADAQLSFLSRVNGKAFDAQGNEVCSKELDANQVLQVAMEKLVTPMTGPDGNITQTPLEVIMDVIADVNRAAPGSIDKLAATDYASIADNLSDFLLNKQRGMEQFYEIVRQGIVR